MGKALSKWIYKKREVRVLMVGLDAAGKTTILYKLKLGEVVTTIPTIGFNVETLETDGINITAWDIGLRNKSRPLLRHYYPNTDGVVFVVDSIDKERADETKELLDDIVIAEDELRGVPLLVMANKQDNLKARSKEVIAEELKLRNITDREWNIISCSAVNGDGLEQGLEWLVSVLTGKIVQKDVTRSLMTSVNDVTKTTTQVQETTGFYGLGMIKASLQWIQQLSGCKSQAGKIAYSTATSPGLPS